MGIYDTIMTKVRGDDPLGTVAPPGIESVSTSGALPPLSPEAFKLMFGEEVPDTFGSTTTTTSGGKKKAVYQADDMQPLKGGSRESQGGGAASSGLGGQIAKLAISFQGTPYVWGGTTPKGFDCSGFVQYVFRQMGINLPRMSFQQANSGTKIGLGSLRPGDLVAWDNGPRNPGADHIAIFLGSGLIAEAPSPGKPLRVRKLGKNEGAWGVRVL